VFLFAQDPAIQQVIHAIDAIKTQNFYVQTMGILVAGELSDDDIAELQTLQTKRPRHMRILVTQNGLIRDVYSDFTYLAKTKEVDAILIWPSDVWQDPVFQKKVCQMSMRSKVPVIGLQPGWVTQGALLEFDIDKGTFNLLVNENICRIYNYVPTSIQGYSIRNN